MTGAPKCMIQTSKGSRESSMDDVLGKRYQKNDAQAVFSKSCVLKKVWEKLAESASGEQRLGRLRIIRIATISPLSGDILSYDFIFFTQETPSSIPRISKGVTQLPSPSYFPKSQFVNWHAGIISAYRECRCKFSVFHRGERGTIQFLQAWAFGKAFGIYFSRSRSESRSRKSKH